MQRLLNLGLVGGECEGWGRVAGAGGHEGLDGFERLDGAAGAYERCS